VTKTIPSPDPFDTTTYPYGKEAGANKFSTTSCPTCGKLPTHPTTEEYPDANAQISASGYFMFRDKLSAKEYYISGMCQACQDSVFGGSDE
jgi:hypothetical protein